MSNELEIAISEEKMNEFFKITEELKQFLNLMQVRITTFEEKVFVSMFDEEVEMYAGEFLDKAILLYWNSEKRKVYVKCPDIFDKPFCECKIEVRIKAFSKFNELVDIIKDRIFNDIQKIKESL